MNCGMKCLKFLLFAFNLIIWVCGIAVLGVGIYSRIKVGNWDDIIDDSTIPSAANLMIAAGCIVMVLGFLGCCGAWKQNQCLLILYAISLILIFVLEIAAGIYAYTQKDDVLDKLEEGLKKTIHESYQKKTPADDSLTKAVDWFQENIDCCGAANKDDWLTSSWYNTTGKTANTPVPESCCITVAKGCNVERANNTLHIHTNGCVDEGRKFVKDNLWKIGGVGVGIAFVQLFGIVAAILLCRAIKAEEM